MKKIGFSALSFLLLLVLFSCKQKKKDKAETEAFLPVLSFIKSQVAEVDTSLYSIRRVTYIDSIRSDTAFFRREQFRALAADFLTLPDISDPKNADRYTEDKQFDETLNRAIFTYLPKKPDEESIQRQEVLVRPDPSNDQITSIIIDYVVNNKDSSVQKKMLWQVDHSFQVTTIRQLPGQPETVSTYKVIWNDEDN